MIDSALFPVSTAMCGALFVVAPGAMRQLHWHLAQDEWQFIINGTLEVGIFLSPGNSTKYTLRGGDLGFAPSGSAHYLRNVDTKNPAYGILIFNNGVFTDIEMNNFLGVFPSAWVATSLNISLAAAQDINYNQPGYAPAKPKQ